MATTFLGRWGEYSTQTTYLSTELNALADAANKLGAAIDLAAAGRPRIIEIEIVLATVDLSASVNPAIYFWQLARTDGTNFEDGGDAVTPAGIPEIKELQAINGAQRVVKQFAVKTPDQMKILVGNRAGAALAATGNTIKYRLLDNEYNSAT